MSYNLSEIKEIVSDFIDNYTNEVIEEDSVNFYNDAFVMLKQFHQLDNEAQALTPIYNNFINHLISNSSNLKEHLTFDFSTINSLDKLINNTEFKNLTPIYTSYNFTDTEETIDQIFEELKAVKEFQKELKEEINYLLDEYKFHLDHLTENVVYNFYTYDILENISLDDDEKLEEIILEKKKFIQKCTDKLNKK